DGTCAASSIQLTLNATRTQAPAATIRLIALSTHYYAGPDTTCRIDFAHSAATHLARMHAITSALLMMSTIATSVLSVARVQMHYATPLPPTRSASPDVAPKTPHIRSASACFVGTGVRPANL